MGLEGFSHINVLWWFDRLDSPAYRAVTTSERPYRDAPDRLGIFATRSPVRPNPLALTAVPVLAIDAGGGVVRIPFIDAEPGTPVLDIKPKDWQDNGVVLVFTHGGAYTLYSASSSLLCMTSHRGLSGTNSSATR